MNWIVSAVLLSLLSVLLKETGAYIGIYIELNESRRENPLYEIFFISTIGYAQFTVNPIERAGVLFRKDTLWPHATIIIISGRILNLTNGHFYPRKGAVNAHRS